MKKQHLKIRSTVWLLIVAFVLLISLVLSYSLKGTVKKSADSTGPIPAITATLSGTSHAEGDDFDVDMVISGGGQEYTGFSATVGLTNLTVTSITVISDPEDINTSASGTFASWTPGGTPTASRLSFSGAVKNTRTEDLPIYKVKVKGTAAGTASINITNGAVNQVVGGVDIVNIISSPTSTSTYTITGGDTAVDPGTGDTGGTDPGSLDPGAGTTTVNPTCSDKKKNGSEKGIDCGGTCKACKTTTTITTPGAAPTETTVPTQTVMEQLAAALTEADFQPIWEGVNTTSQITINATAPTDVVTVEQDALNGITFSGKAFSGTKVDLFVFSNKIQQSTVADSENNWKIVLTTALASGQHEAYTVLTDKDSANFRTSDKFTFTVDPVQKLVKKVSAASTATETTTTPTTTATTDSTSKSKILFMAIGVVVAIFIVVILVMWFVKRKSNGIPEGVSVDQIKPTENNFSQSSDSQDNANGVVASPDNTKETYFDNLEGEKMNDEKEEAKKEVVNNDSDSLLNSDPLANDEETVQPVVPDQPAVSTPEAGLEQTIEDAPVTASEKAPDISDSSYSYGSIADLNSLKPAEDSANVEAPLSVPSDDKLPESPVEDSSDISAPDELPAATDESAPSVPPVDDIVKPVDDTSNAQVPPTKDDTINKSPKF